MTNVTTCSLFVYIITHACIGFLIICGVHWPVHPSSHPYSYLISTKNLLNAWLYNKNYDYLLWSKPSHNYAWCSCSYSFNMHIGCLSPSSTDSTSGLGTAKWGCGHNNLTCARDYLNMTWKPSAMERKTVTIATAGLVVLADPMQLGLSTARNKQH